MGAIRSENQLRKALRSILKHSVSQKELIYNGTEAKAQLYPR